jgi:hypothetical protein
MAMSTFTNRMIGAAKLNVATYEEVESDRAATSQALAVVVMSSVAAGLGISRNWNISEALVGAIAALLGWFIWSTLTYLIGTKVLPEPQTNASIGELLRTTGFSSAPGVLRLLGVVPILGRVVWLAISFWMLLTMVIAVRQALDYKSTGRAVGVCVIGWLVYVVVSLFFLGLPAAR